MPAVALQFPVGAGLPAKQATRRMAPASPVFAGKPAPTEFAVKSDSYDLFHRSLPAPRTPAKPVPRTAVP
ncbi:hypothetical protein F3J44_05700 [Pantoea sp. Tr-811]|nr:hypothetical protein [Pantoea sp. Tr-811]